MSKLLNKHITRRSMLSNTTKGALSVAAISSLGLGSAAAGLAKNDAYWTKERTSQYLCKQIHLHKSVELGKIMGSPNLDQAEKNLAIKTAVCPSCGVRIIPGVAHDTFPNAIG